MARVIITLFNEHGPQFRFTRPEHLRHEIEAEKAIWRNCSAEVESRGFPPLTITETVETMEEAA
jgi:hypothetical protein